MRRRPSGLWLPDGFSFAEHRRMVKRIRFRSTGEVAKVTVDDSGTVMQIETDNRLDAIVRPAAVRLRLRS